MGKLSAVKPRGQWQAPDPAIMNRINNINCYTVRTMQIERKKKPRETRHAVISFSLHARVCFNVLVVFNSIFPR